MQDIEFDTAYSAVTGERVGIPYLPGVEVSDTVDVTIDGLPAPANGWHVLTGYTRQYGYRGAVMHPSETVTDARLREWVEESGGDTFAVTEVREVDGSLSEGDPIGWAVLYRLAGD